jgi:membrane protein DedA with SNARE-associated domain
LHGLFVFVATYGYAAAFVLILIESLGIPVPGEGILIATALFAAHTHRLNIAGVIATASVAAFLGTSLGYLAGRSVGVALLTRYGRFVGLTPARARLGRYLFLRHGAEIVFIGRFVAFLRAFEGLLAGANQMPLRRFLIVNALGAVAWSSCIGLGAFFFGRAFVHVSRPFGVAALALTALAAIGVVFYLRGQEAALQIKADAAFSGSGAPLRPGA